MSASPTPRRRMKSYPGQLSGGLRQRISIAMALSCRPRLVICDEPTTNLDVSIQAQIIELLRGLKDEFGFSIIFVTHDLGLTPHIADRILVLYAGHAVEEGPVRDVLDRPGSPLHARAAPVGPVADERARPAAAHDPGRRATPRPAFRRRPLRQPLSGCDSGVCDLVEPGWSDAGPDHRVACHRFARDGRTGTAWAQ